jgi:hypothetical protein
MSTAEEFTNQRFSTILMSRPWDNLEASMIANHAACSFLSRDMQLLFLNSLFGPACSGPGQASRRQTPFPFFSVPFCGVDPWVTDYITPLANPPSRSMQSVNLYRMALAGQQACPQAHSSLFLVHLGRSNHPVSQWIYFCLWLRSSYVVGSK